MVTVLICAKTIIRLHFVCELEYYLPENLCIIVIEVVICKSPGVSYFMSEVQRDDPCDRCNDIIFK